MRYRVIQWATGTIGRRALAVALRHPQLQVVGVRVFDPAKVGTDVGALVGAPPIGVAATDDVEALIALDADCVLYMPGSWSVDELCRLLASGKNVVTTCSELFHPRRSLPAEMVEKLEAACLAGSSSLYGTGSSPGFITEVLPLALLSVQSRLRRLTIDEFADLSRRPSPEMLFGIMGMGRAPRPTAGRAEHLRRSFGPSLETLAELIGLHVDRIESQAEVALATRTVEIAAGKIAQGTVAAQRTTVSAFSGEEVRLLFRATWYCSDALDSAWSLGATGWRVDVDGDAPLKFDLAFPIGTDQLAAVTPGYTAHRPVNAVPAVCRARPGLLDTADLPLVVPDLS
jgi:4-hydroxy-tetrahydrodipicolinate reductase